MISVIGGLPMGIGLFAVWPLAKKFGKRNVTMAGFILYAAGSLICCLAPRSMAVVLTGQFIKNIGGLPSAYVFMALLPMFWIILNGSTVSAATGSLHLSILLWRQSVWG